MIGILSKNPDDKFLHKLNLPYKLIDEFDPKNPLNVDGLFIDWVPKIPVYEDAWMRQASLLQANIKSGMPIVIFDRAFSLTEKEVDWCRKFNTHLFDPALHSDRIGFRYLPEWIYAYDIAVGDEDREHDVVYSHYQLEYQLKGFEKWIKDFARLFPEKRVAYSSFTISEFKIEEFKKNNLEFLPQRHPIFDSGHFTVAFDVDRAYKVGYFSNQHFFAMNMGCLPLLPIEHKYFHGMFKGLIAKDLTEMEYYVSLYGRVKDVMIEEIFDRVRTIWPEFTVDHATDIVRNCYE